MDMELKKHGDDMRYKILDYIIQYISEHGYSPNYDEIREAVGLKSKSTIHSHINKMFENGMIETDCGIGTPRAIRVPGYKFVKEEFATDTNVGTNGWIPVEERMPEENIEVLVSISEIDGSIYTGTSWVQDGVWVIKKTPLHPTVIAWQPLPEPYTKGE